MCGYSGWNKPALKDNFRHGLNENILTGMACQDKKTSLDSLIDVAICLNRIPLLKSPSLAEPMQVFCKCPSTGEGERRLHDQLCFYCGQPDHHICLCPVRHKLPDVSVTESWVAELPNPTQGIRFQFLYTVVYVYGFLRPCSLFQC